MMKNRLLFAGLFLLSLFFVYFYGGLVPYVLFHVTILLPIISLTYAIIILARFKFGQEIDRKFTTKGDRVNFIFSVYNEDLFLYPFIKVTFCGSETIFHDQFQSRSFSILPYGKKSFFFELECKYRGSYDVGLRSIEICDFLGIFRFKYKVPEPKYVIVYPKIVQLDRFQLNTDYLSESHSILRSRNEDMSSIENIRKYTAGDSLKKIHWKLTAKTGKLLVKKFQSTSETSSVFFLDIFENPYSFEYNTMIEDKVIEAAVSVLNYCVNSWIPIKMVYYTESIMEYEAKNPLMFDEMYNILAKVKFEGNIELKDLVDIYLKRRVNKTNIIICSSNLSYGLYDVIYEAKAAGYEISLIYISPEEATGEKRPGEKNILSFLPEIGVLTYKLNLSDDIKNVLESRI